MAKKHKNVVKAELRKRMEIKAIRGIGDGRKKSFNHIFDSLWIFFTILASCMCAAQRNWMKALNRIEYDSIWWLLRAAAFDCRFYFLPPRHLSFIVGNHFFGSDFNCIWHHLWSTLFISPRVFKGTLWHVDGSNDGGWSAEKCTESRYWFNKCLFYVPGSFFIRLPSLGRIFDYLTAAFEQ